MSQKLKRELEWIENALDKEYKVTREGSEGGRVLWDDIRFEIQPILGRHLYSYDMEGIGDEAVNREGRFARRVSSYMYKNYSIKLDAKAIEAVGNLAARHTVKDAQNLVRLDRDLWTPGDFGDGDSCFFLSRKAAPKLIFRYGGAAAKIYTDDGKPQARAWLVPRYGAAVIFNPYTARGVRTYDPTGVARLLTATGAPFQGHAIKVARDLQNHERTNGTIWINNGNGAIVLGKGVAEFALYDDVLDLRIKNGPTCARCGDLPDTVMMHNGHSFCVDCYPVKTCACCSFQMEADYMVMGENDSGEASHYCPACYIARMRTCKCGATHARHAMRYAGDGVWACLRCVKRDEDARKNATSFVFNVGTMTASSTGSAYRFDLPRPRGVVAQLPPGEPSTLFQRVTGQIFDMDRRTRLAQEIRDREQAQMAAQAHIEEQAFIGEATMRRLRDMPIYQHLPYTETGLRPVPNDDEPALATPGISEAIADLGRTLERRMGEGVGRAVYGDWTVTTDEVARWTANHPADTIRGAFTPDDEAT